MAARRKRSRSSALNVTAENIGTALGRVAARLDAWKRQRAEIAGEIQKILKSAQGLLGEIGDTAGDRVEAVRSAAGRSKGGRPKGYKMSEETKRKLRAAWKRRKAAKDKEKVTG